MMDATFELLGGEPGRMLGRKPAPEVASCLPRLSKVALHPLAEPPVSVDHYSGIPFQMFGNDYLGDCTVAALFNGVIERTVCAFGLPAIASMELVQDVYAAVAGWSPNVPGSDQGARITDVLTYFARTGVQMGRGGPEAGLWAPIATADHTELQQAIWLLGSATIGLLLPDSARAPGVWDVPPSGPTGSGAPGGWGAHCIILAGYDRGAGLYYGITWGGVQPITERFLAAYMDEAYAVFAPGELLGVDGMSPEQFDFPTLRAALDSL